MDRRIGILGFIWIVALAGCSTDPNITGSLKLYHQLDGQRFDMTGLESSLDCSPTTELPPADLPVSGNENEDDIQISAPIGGEENPSESVEEPSEASPEESEGDMAPSLDGSDSEAPMAGNDATEPEITVSSTAPSSLVRLATRQSSSPSLTISFSYPNFVIRSDGEVTLTGTWEPLDDNTVLITVDGVKQKVDIEIREDGVIVPILPEGLSLNPTCNPDPVTIPPDGDGGDDNVDDGNDNEDDDGDVTDPVVNPPVDDENPPIDDDTEGDDSEDDFVSDFTPSAEATELSRALVEAVFREVFRAQYDLSFYYDGEDDAPDYCVTTDEVKTCNFDDFEPVAGRISGTMAMTGRFTVGETREGGTLLREDSTLSDWGIDFDHFSWGGDIESEDSSGDPNVLLTGGTRWNGTRSIEWPHDESETSHVSVYDTRFASELEVEGTYNAVLRNEAVCTGTILDDTDYQALSGSEATYVNEIEIETGGRRINCFLELVFSGPDDIDWADEVGSLCDVYFDYDGTLESLECGYVN